MKRAVRCSWLLSTALVTALSPLSVSAAPSISGTSGTWSHDGSVTVSGSGFGTKSTAAPRVWDNAAHGQSLSTRYSGYGPTTGSSTVNLKYSTDTYGQGFPHSRATHYITGSHQNGNSATNGANVGMWIDLPSRSFPYYIFVSYYVSLLDTWSIGATHNYKFLNYNEGLGGPYNLPTNWYIANDYPPGTSIGLLDDSGYPTGTSLVFPDQNGHGRGGWGDIIELTNPGMWVKHEHEIKLTSGTDGYIRTYVNGVLRVNYLGKTDGYAGTDRSVLIGGYLDERLSVHRRFFTDVYFDSVPNRVMLCTGSTWASRGACEPQIPSAWSATSTTVTVNLGAHPTGTTRYVYVVDSSNLANSSGYPVTTASGGGDTTPPASPMGLVVE